MAAPEVRAQGAGEIKQTLLSALQKLLTPSSHPSAQFAASLREKTPVKGDGGRWGSG